MISNDNILECFKLLKSELKLPIDNFDDIEIIIKNVLKKYFDNYNYIFDLVVVRGFNGLYNFYKINFNNLFKCDNFLDDEIF